MMSDTTSILELPTDPLLPPSNNGISQSLPPTAPPLTLDQSTISQIVNGLQQASSTGITQLPSRDIPRNTENIVQDPQIQPNYIPPVSSNLQEHSQPVDYIQNNQEMDEIINKYNTQLRNGDSLDDVYSEIQTPLLLSVLYFLFQLPIFKKILIKYFSVLFYKDGNYNINGYLFTSILFGLIFYLIMKIMIYFNTF